jgi:hypothetical protein
LAFSGSSTQLMEVGGEGCSGGGVPGGFAIPASSFGIGSEALDIFQLVGDGVGELGTGGEVGAVLANVRVGARASGLMPGAVSVGDPCFDHFAVEPVHFVGNDGATDRRERQLSAHLSDRVIVGDSQGRRGEGRVSDGHLSGRVAQQRHQCLQAHSSIGELGGPGVVSGHRQPPGHGRRPLPRGRDRQRRVGSPRRRGRARFAGGPLAVKDLPASGTPAELLDAAGISLTS